MCPRSAQDSFADVDRTRFANNLERIRTDRGLTQDALAEAVGVSMQTIWAYEAGRQSPRHKTLERLAEALDVGIAELYGEPKPAAHALPPDPPALARLAEYAKAQGVKPPEPDEMTELREIPFRGQPTPQSYLFMLLAIRDANREG